ncbi:helix-turn-helix transcriptional regulator [Streptomyces sp. HNM0575]|uniref:helix-turn-helix transcriptional regulator n=1 Tax=Streptomyces sp. HNM0575 TaxID=2716338 RepID=UPI00145E00F3|nr:helix-turn-helix transcriptional regulator [Streptomyces sp. HNM0575]NLU74096.1 helix-turn-helix transcriptional regulator [Streptomyces sp. HNM0575]
MAFSEGSGHPPAPATTASYEFVRAPRTLGALVASTVGYRSEGAAPQLHRGLPAPYLTLIFSLGGPVVGGDTPEHAQGAHALREEIIVGGLHHRPMYIAQPSCEDGVQLAVHPLAARALFGVPAAELTETAGRGESVLGRPAVYVHERLRECGSWDERFAVLTRYLRRRAVDEGRRAEVRPEVAEAWRWMTRHQGAGSLDAMARHVALSRRQLSTLFHREVGAGPKQINRLMRFERARQEVVRAVAEDAPAPGAHAPDLSEIAARCGFFDHSHLVRDFQQYTGLSPSGWISEERRNIQAGGHRNGEEWDT